MATSETIEGVVEDTQLPRRLKDEVYSVLNEKGVTDEETAAQIVTRVEHEYVDSRVDPLDPVGTVSAQSIGEPGTQMSIPSDEEIVVRRDGTTQVLPIGPFVDSLLESRETRTVDDHEVGLAPDGLEVLSLGRDETVEWRSIEEISRHETPEELLEFELASGRSIRATANHSFVTRKDNDVVPVAGSDLEAGDWLPVVRSFDIAEPQTHLDLRELFDPSEYWFTSAITDGGVETAVPGAADQLQNKRDALGSGRLADGYVYPRQGTVGLPERIELDETVGFFVGAFLAEGHTTEYYTSISNVDETFLDRIRAFADRFELTSNEYDNDSGFATSHDLRLNGTVLARLLDELCVANGSKRVPPFAYGAPDSFVSALLCGYFSGDGNVGDASVRASSRSGALISGIALLLARFGISTTRGEQDGSTTLRVPTKHVERYADRVGMVGERDEQLSALVESVDADGPDSTDQIPNFGDAIDRVVDESDIPQRQFNSASNRQRIGRNRLQKLVQSVESSIEDEHEALESLRSAAESDVVWDRIESIESVESEHEHVYDVSVAGLETFTTAEGVVTHNTMNTFHYAGVAEIDVTQGLPRLIELVDARKTPDTPTMKVHLEDEFAHDRERAHEVVWKIEATRILALGDVSTNVADMLVSIDLNEETLHERWPTVDSLDVIVSDIAETIESELGVETYHQGTRIEFGPDEPSYRDLLQLVEELRDIVFKGIGDISRVVIRKEDIEGQDEQEFVLHTEGAAFGKVLEIEGVDASRTTTNNIHEVYRVLGVEAARERIIEETMDTLAEQGLDDVNIRHLMLVADIMTNNGEIESIGRHGISGNKESVLARAAFEVTVNHLLDAAVHGESDELDGVTENVIIGKPIKLGTGDVTLRMGSTADTE